MENDLPVAVVMFLRVIQSFPLPMFIQYIITAPSWGTTNSQLRLDVILLVIS